MKNRGTLPFSAAASWPAPVHLFIIVVTLCAIGLPASASARAPMADLSEELEPASVVQGTIFPDVEGGYNGMKISYTVTGALLGVPTDLGISNRFYKGRLGEGTLTVSGWVEQNNGYGASLSVSLEVGKEEKSTQSIRRQSVASRVLGVGAYPCRRDKGEVQHFHDR